LFFSYFLSFLWHGIIAASFRLSGKYPDSRLELKQAVNVGAQTCLASLMILVGMPTLIAFDSFISLRVLSMADSLLNFDDARVV